MHASERPVDLVERFAEICGDSDFLGAKIVVKQKQKQEMYTHHDVEKMLHL